MKSFSIKSSIDVHYENTTHFSFFSIILITWLYNAIIFVLLCHFCFTSILKLVSLKIYKNYKWNYYLGNVIISYLVKACLHKGHDPSFIIDFNKQNLHRICIQIVTTGSSTSDKQTTQRSSSFPLILCIRSLKYPSLNAFTLTFNLSVLLTLPSF